MLLYQPFEHYYAQFDSEIYNILWEAHIWFSKTKMTELEVEIALTIARYVANFKTWKDKLIEILTYITKFDLKRLRIKEKGHLYLQLAEIWAKAGYKRKESWYLVLASEHLWKKADYNTNVDWTKNSN